MSTYTAQDFKKGQPRWCPDVVTTSSWHHCIKHWQRLAWLLMTQPLSLVSDAPAVCHTIWQRMV